MGYAFAFFLGLAIGSVFVFLSQLEKAKSIKQREAAAAALKRTNYQTLRELSEREVSVREYEQQAVAYSELKNENQTIKRDLQNIYVNLRKTELDRELQQREQRALDERGRELGGRYLKDTIKWIGSSLTPNNYAASKKRLKNTIERCRNIGLQVSDEEEAAYLGDLKAEYEKVVKAAVEREEQARIKAQIREEQRREREFQQELKRIENERAAIERALTTARDKEEIDRLKAQLVEAEERAQRAISQAQLTRSGHVYVISNIGSFGDGVFKIGMTRRLEPEIRVKELSDASVPFPFDVHMMISCDDAPALENALHKALHKTTLNKVNPRKEFFRSDIQTIRTLVEEHHGQVDYVADPEALEYRQSIEISDEDFDYVESVYDALEDDGELVED